MKTCSKCGVEKPLTDFPKRSGRKDGHQGCCRACKKPAPGISTKRCSKCGAEKPLTDFTKDARNSDGLQSQCRQCLKTINARAVKKYRIKYPARFKAILRNCNLKRLYGITVAEKEALIAGQKGCCACCGDSFSGEEKAHVDHIHGSDPIVIRGVLCSQCNTGLGLFKESSERLAKATAYLLKNKT